MKSRRVRSVVVAVGCLGLLMACATANRMGGRGPAAAPGLGPNEDIITTQIARVRAHQSFFDTKDHAINPIHGGRTQISSNPSVAGFWQVPPLPVAGNPAQPDVADANQDFLEVHGADGRFHPVPIKMGAIQASVLPSGKVLMVSGSSNRGDSRPGNPTTVTSQFYGLIDNTEIFDPSLVPLVPEDLKNINQPSVDSIEFPGDRKAPNTTQAEPLDQKKPPSLYERPFSLPPEQAFVNSSLSPALGTVQDPQFCAEERPAGTPLFNNGISFFDDPASPSQKLITPADPNDPSVKLLSPENYCSLARNNDIGAGAKAPLPLNEVGTPDPVEPNIDLFCGGNHPLPSGDVLFAGGTRKAVTFQNGITVPFYGVKRTQIFDWKQETWRDAGDSHDPQHCPRGLCMGDGRWYPTLVELPDGKVFIIGGMNHRGEISHTLEVYDSKSRAMSELIDFRPVGAKTCDELRVAMSTPRLPCRMNNEPFTILDPVAGRRFDNFPRVFLTTKQPTLPGCTNDNDPQTRLHCVRLLITGDGSAEGDRDVGMDNTVYVDLDTRAFTDAQHNQIRVSFAAGPQRNIRADGRPQPKLDPSQPIERQLLAGQSHFYTTHLYPTTTYDPTNENGDILILGGSIGKYDPLHVAQDVKQDPVSKLPELNPDTSTNFNTKPDHRTASDMEKFNGTTGTFDRVYENFLGSNDDESAKVGTSFFQPALRGRPTPCDPKKPINAPGNFCGGPFNLSGMVNPNVVVLPTRQMLVLGGGNYSYEDPLFNPVLFTPTSDLLVHPDQNATPVGWQREWARSFMNPFHLPRLYHNTALLLPDGRIFLGSGNTFISFLKGVDQQGLPIVGPLGGQANRYNNFDGAVGLSGAFRALAGSSGVLSNLSVDLPAEQYQVEVFSPPYMFSQGQSTEQNERPVIKGFHAGGMSSTFHPLPDGKRWIDPDHEDIVPYGAQIDLALGKVTSGTAGRVTMVRLGGVTHAFNFSQRLHSLRALTQPGCVPLNLRAQAARDNSIVCAQSARPGDAPVVSVQAPVLPRVAPPGYYMVFYVNSAGRPSEARIVRLCNVEQRAKGFACSEDPAS